MKYKKYYDGSESEFNLEPNEKQTWIDALRSGQYKQGIRELYNEGTHCYCVLGVHAALFNSADSIGLYWLQKEEIPEEIQEMMVDMNDSGRSFEQLADWIEENL